MKQKGFTILDLLSTLTILTIITAIGIPQFRNFMLAARTNATANTLFESITLARQVAVYRNKNVLLKPITNWNNGWDVFVDMDGNNILSAADQPLLRHTADHNLRISAHLTSNNAIIYSGAGASFTTNGAYLSGRFRVCPIEPNQPGKALVIRFGGRVRTENISASECESL